MAGEQKPTKTDSTKVDFDLPLQNETADSSLPTNAAEDEPDLSKLDLKGPAIAIFVCLYVFGVGYLAIQSAKSLSLYEGTLPYLIVLAGLLVFWVRQNFKFLYGLIEVVFGAFLCLSEFPDIKPMSPSDLVSVLTTAVILKQAAGLYVIVRGLDNIGKAIKKYKDEDKTSWLKKKRILLKAWWARWFGFD